MDDKKTPLVMREKATRTLRDEFAMAAMTGALSNVNLMAVFDEHQTKNPEKPILSKFAYGVADEMMKFRNDEL